jgi:hypothetical protein
MAGHFALDPAWPEAPVTGRDALLEDFGDNTFHP